MRIKVRKKLDPYLDEGKTAEEFLMINTDGIHAVCIDKGGGLNYIPFKELYVIDGYYIPGFTPAETIIEVLD